MEPTTKQFRKRNAILNYLQNTKAHPSAETVYADLKQQIPDLSMGTVYRNLNLFRQQGLASVIATVRGPVPTLWSSRPRMSWVTPPA